jgi:thermitase
MENGFSRSAVGIGVLALSIVLGYQSISQARMSRLPDGYPRAPGEIIVKLRSNGLSAMSAYSALSSTLSDFSVLEMRDSSTDSDLKLVRLKDDTQVEDAINRLQDVSSVEYAEPNYIVQKLGTRNGTPNDGRFKELWGINNTGQKDFNQMGMPAQQGVPEVDVDVRKLWQQGKTGSRSVVVAVIDTGIDWEHEDLKDNLYTNPGEAGALANNGVDDDQNGFVDDVHGWNFTVDKQNRPVNNRNSSDDEGHGTHVAGTIGASGDNGIGVTGVNWQVSLLPLKFLDSDGSGTSMGAIDAINYATKMKVQVMNNSWGGGAYSRALEDAIKNAQAAGILFVAASGNNENDNDVKPTYPANYAVDNVLSVGAIDNRANASVWKTSTGIVAGGSSYGATTVHVFAPGTKIVSTVPGDKLCTIAPPPPGERCAHTSALYASYNGTSMATPHVSGVAALLMSADRSLSYADIKSRLIRTSKPTWKLRSKGVARGYISAFNALNNIVPPSIEPDPSRWVRVPQVFESAHPYTNKLDQRTTISYPGAKYLRVHFEKIQTEARYDHVRILTPLGEQIQSFSGSYNDVTSEYVEGDSLIIQLQTDYSTVDYGYRISRIEVIL